MPGNFLDSNVILYFAARDGQKADRAESLMRSGVTLVIAVHHVEDLPRGMTHGLHLHKRQARIVDSYFAT